MIWPNILSEVGYIASNQRIPRVALRKTGERRYQTRSWKRSKGKSVAAAQGNEDVVK